MAANDQQKRDMASVDIVDQHKRVADSDANTASGARPRTESNATFASLREDRKPVEDPMVKVLSLLQDLVVKTEAI